MSTIRVALTDSQAVSDLSTFVSRARRLDPRGAIRIQGFDRGVAAYVAPLFPAGLVDPTPTIIGVRTAAGDECRTIDTVQLLESVDDTLARATTAQRDTFTLTGDEVRVPWAAVTPPRHGWAPDARLDPTALAAVLAAGIDEISIGAPEGSGEAAVQRLRERVWARSTAALGGLPAGVALALDGLGFMTASGTLAVLRSGAWFRVSAPFGDVIGKQRH